MPDTRQLKDLSVLLVDDENEYRSPYPLVMSGLLEREITFPDTYQKSREEVRSGKHDIILLDGELSYFPDASVGTIFSELLRDAEKYSPQSVTSSISGLGIIKGYIHHELIHLVAGEMSDYETLQQEAKNEIKQRIERLLDLENEVERLFHNKGFLPVRKGNGIIISNLDEIPLWARRTYGNISDARAAVNVYLATLSDSELEQFYQGKTNAQEFLKMFKAKYGLK